MSTLKRRPDALIRTLPADAANPDVGASSVRTIGGLPVRVLPGNPMHNDSIFEREGHTLWIGAFPVASVLYSLGNRRADGSYEWGWTYHTAHTVAPHGPFADLEALLDHAAVQLGAPLPPAAA